MAKRSLKNSETANYLLAYFQAIENGSITVGHWVRLWYEKVITGLENREFFFDQRKAAKAINFIETFCHHHEGAQAPNLITLELWQKALISVLFGIVDQDGNRQFRECLIVIARKNGKTLLAAAIAEYAAICDGEYGARVFFVAPKLQQANLCFDAFCQMIWQEREISALVKKRKTDLYIPESNSSAQALAFSAKKSDGLNVSLCVCDEIASWRGDPGLKFYEVLKSSCGARRQPLILSISTAGYEREGIYDELMKRATRVLLGDGKEKRFAPFLYTIDDPAKWNDINELRKSNPNLGVSVSVSYLLDEISVAEGSLSKKAEFLTKYCNVAQSSSQAWLPAVVVEQSSGAELSLADFRGCYCVGGIDLSRTTDLTACVAVIQRGGVQHVFAKFFLPAEKLEEATARDGLPYQIYAQRGLLQLSGDNVVEYKDVYQWFVDLVEKYKIYPLKIGYDRYSSTYLVQDLKQYGFHVDDVFQGYNLTPVIRQFEGELKDGKFNFGDNDLLKVHLLNAALKMETDTERVKLIKLNAVSHIDGTAALLDALTVRQKYWSEIGKQLTNQTR